ncbi:hypothetical protein JZ751_002860, partial [Albula glossodonta]
PGFPPKCTVSIYARRRLHPVEFILVLVCFIVANFCLLGRNLEYKLVNIHFIERRDFWRFTKCNASFPIMASGDHDCEEGEFKSLEEAQPGEFIKHRIHSVPMKNMKEASEPCGGEQLSG